PKRDFWRSFRRQLVWLDWQIWMLAHLGLLNSENTASRWLKRQLAQLEHGLRCMLVIGCQTRPAASPAKAGVQDIYQQSGSQLSLGRRNHKRFSYSLKAFGYPLSSRPSEAQTPGPIPQTLKPEDKWVPASATLTRLGRNDVEEISTSQPKFSYSLKAFGHTQTLSSRPSEAQTPGPTPQTLQTADKWVPASATLTRLGRNDVEDSTPAFIQLQAHIHMLADVFTNTDAHIARMARQIQRCGLRVRRRLTRPANQPASQITEKLTPAHQSAPAFIDTS
ncbi:MAG: hypothetical protein CME88_15035, partial [Hirschia sp.]|nr:hypothetical protein [Hirschia sp.]